MRPSDALPETTILLAEDDDGHAELITLTLRESGVASSIIRFVDGAEVIDFLFQRGEGPHCRREDSYLLLLDIRMPRVDGIDVLRLLKQDKLLRRLPVIMLTTSDDPREIQQCYSLGCSNYITKHIDFEHFACILRRLAMFLVTLRLPSLNNDSWE